MERTAGFFFLSGKISRREAGALLLALAAALALWLFFAAGYRRDAVKGISKSLVTINSYKISEISGWRGDHIREAVRLSRHPFLGEIVSEERARPGSRRAQLVTWARDHAQQKRYESMAFLSPAGAVIAATPGYSSGKEKEFAEAFGIAAKNGTAQITDFYLAADGHPHLTMLSPISPGGRGGKLLCLLVINIDPGTELYPLLKAAPLFFAKAETLLVRKEGEHVLYLNELDYRKGPALKFSRPLADERLPAAAALKNHSGFFAGVDYRGVKVFSALGPVEGSGWAVVTQIDQKSVLAPFRTKALLALALILPAAVLSCAVVLRLMRRRERAGEKQAQDAIAKLNERLLLAARAGRFGIWDWDVINNRIFWDDQMFELYGLEKKDFLGIYAAWLKTTHPDDRSRCQEEIQQALTGEKAYDTEYRVVRPDGSVRHIRSKADVFRDAAGVPLRMLGVNLDITERMRVEEALRDSEARYKTLFSEAAEGMLVADLRTKLFLFGNPAVCRMLGYPEEELMRLSVMDIHPKEEIAGVLGALDAQMRGEEKTVEVPCQRKNGEVFYAAVTTAKITVDGLECALGFFTDITGRRQAEAALRESEAYIRAVLDNLPIGIAVNSVDPEVNFSYTNDLFPKLYRTTKEALARPDGFWEAVYPEPGQREGLRKKVLEDCASGDPARMRWPDVPVVRPGEPATYVTGQNIPLPGGKLMISTVMDVTERKLAEEKLAEAAKNWRDTFDAIDDIVWMMDAENRIIRVNKATKKTFRLPAEKIIGRHCWEVVHGSTQPIPECPALPARKNIRRETAEYVLNGRMFEIIVDPIVGADGNYAGAVHILRDITVRKLAELEKEKLSRGLEEKRREMESFLYITTHDLRGPLVNIQGFSRNLERYVQDLRRLLATLALPEETGRELAKLSGGSMPDALKFVLESANKMDALIASLLKVSRVGRVEMKPETVEMNGLVKNILDSLFYNLEAAGGKVNCGSLPACRADQAATSQIFTNLLDNAVKYLHKDRPLVITVTGQIKGDMAEYTVADNGAGIPASDLEKIWSVFYQGRASRTGGKKGEGIGLHMVKLMAEKNGGSISVASTEGEGTVFRVQLPAAGGRDE